MRAVVRRRTYPDDRILNQDLEVEMALPGFNAERALFGERGHYITPAISSTPAGGVAPQLQTTTGASTCTRVCNCCRRTKNRFCCSHCRWCSGPIGSTGVAFPS